MVGENVDDIRHGHFKNNVHTAFQVKTEANFHLTALFERVDSKIDLLVVDRIEILLTSLFAHGSSLTFVMACDEREGKVEAANEYQQQCDKLYNSFVLHFGFLCYLFDTLHF